MLSKQQSRIPYHHGKIVSLYRRNMNRSQQDLADAMGVSLRTVQRMEQSPMIKDLERRRFLVGLLGIPAIQMGLELDESLPKQQTKLLLNEDRISFYEGQLDMRWQMLYMGGPRYALAGLEHWLKEVENFEQHTRTTPWHKRTLAVLCMSYQLQGGALRDVLDYDGARKACQKALFIAEELNDAEMKSSALVREGITLLRQEKLNDAIPTLKEALDVIKGYNFPNLRGNILQSLSQLYAKSGQSAKSWETLQLAEDMLQRPAQMQERSHRVFNRSSLTASKGINAVLLHDYDRAIALIDKSIATCSPTMIPKRANMTLWKAEAYYGRGNIDSCTQVAEEAWHLAQSVGAGMVLAQTNHLHMRLADSQSRWKNELCVKRLGALIAMKQ